MAVDTFTCIRDKRLLPVQSLKQRFLKPSLPCTVFSSFLSVTPWVLLACDLDEIVLSLTKLPKEAFFNVLVVLNLFQHDIVKLHWILHLDASKIIIGIQLFHQVLNDFDRLLVEEEWREFLVSDHHNAPSQDVMVAQERVDYRFVKLACGFVQKRLSSAHWLLFIMFCILFGVVVVFGLSEY